MENPNKVMYYERVYGQEVILPPEFQGNQTFIQYHFHEENLKISRQLSVSTNNDVRFSWISAGSSHLMGLDYYNDIWVWDRLYAAPGIRIWFEFNCHRKHNLKIYRISAGWGVFSAQIEDIGLVIWHYDESLQKIPTTTAEVAYFKKERTFKSTTVDYTVVPHTNQHLHHRISLLTSLVETIF